LEIIPVLNKVDLPSANPEEVSDDIIDLLGCDLEDIIHASGKNRVLVLKIFWQLLLRKFQLQKEILKNHYKH